MSVDDSIVLLNLYAREPVQDVYKQIYHQTIIFTNILILLVTKPNHLKHTCLVGVVMTGKAKWIEINHSY